MTKHYDNFGRELPKKPKGKKMRVIVNLQMKPGQNLEHAGHEILKHIDLAMKRREALKGVIGVDEFRRRKELPRLKDEEFAKLQAAAKGHFAKQQMQDLGESLAVSVAAHLGGAQQITVVNQTHEEQVEQVQASLPEIQRQQMAEVITNLVGQRDEAKKVIYYLRKLLNEDEVIDDYEQANVALHVSATPERAILIKAAAEKELREVEKIQAELEDDILKAAAELAELTNHQQKE